MCRPFFRRTVLTEFQTQSVLKPKVAWITGLLLGNDADQVPRGSCTQDVLVLGPGETVSNTTYK